MGEGQATDAASNLGARTVTISSHHRQFGQFPGLRRLEGLVDRMDAPKWPWPTSPVLVAQGKRIFDRATASGGCVDCHAERPGVTLRSSPISRSGSLERPELQPDAAQEG